MTVFDLFDSIGNVDDELIEKARIKKKPYNHKKIFATVGSIAACIAIACISLFALSMNQNSLPPEKEPDISRSEASYSGTIDGSANTSSETVIAEDSGKTAVMRMSFKIYYVKDGKIESKTQTCDALPENVFELWKSENSIGDEVRLISVNLEDNGSTSYSEYSGVGIAEHTTGAYTIYKLTVTKNLENYYGENKELLLESLKKTMTEMGEADGYEPDEYELILKDEEESET